MSDLRAEVPPGLMVFAGYGKGVTFWQFRDEASRSINEFQDVTAVNNYWFTDSTICRQTEGGRLLTDAARPLLPSECHRAHNYGVTTRFVRSLVKRPSRNPCGRSSKWATRPRQRASRPSPARRSARRYGAASSTAPAGSSTSTKLRRTVRDGKCSTRPMRRRCPRRRHRRERPDHRLAPVLNAPFVDGYGTLRPRLDISVKRYDGGFYLVVGNKVNAQTDATIELTCDAKTVEVIDENRTIQVRGRAFQDSFADGNARAHLPHH